MQKHTWHEETDDGKIYHRVLHFGGRWQFFTQDSETKDWIEHLPPTTEFLEKTRLVIFNKYQRKRCPWKLVSSLDRLLGKDLE